MPASGLKNYDIRDGVRIDVGLVTFWRPEMYGRPESKGQPNSGDARERKKRAA
jgi:hypothetical protein